MKFDYMPEKGELVRYGKGSTALAVCTEKVESGWLGRQCMEGDVFFSECAKASEADQRTWFACAPFRDETPEQAMADIAGIAGSDAPVTIHQQDFTDTPKTGGGVARRIDAREGPTPGVNYMQTQKARNPWLYFLWGMIIGWVEAITVIGIFFAHFKP